MKKYSIVGFISGIIAMFFVVFSASADVALPTNVGLPSGTLTSVVSNLTNWLLGIFGFVAIISFLISGLMYFLAAGDDKAEEKAKKQMIWSITGVVIGLVGLVVIYAVDMLLNGGGASFGSGSSSVINNAANSPATGSYSNSSSIINDAANSPATGAKIPSLPQSDPDTSGGAYGDPNALRQENFPF